MVQNAEGKENDGHRWEKILDSIILYFKGVKMRLVKVMKGMPSYLTENRGF